MRAKKLLIVTIFAIAVNYLYSVTFSNRKKIIAKNAVIRTNEMNEMETTMKRVAETEGGLPLNTLITLPAEMASMNIDSPGIDLSTVTDTLHDATDKIIVRAAEQFGNANQSDQLNFYTLEEQLISDAMSLDTIGKNASAGVDINKTELKTIYDYLKEAQGRVGKVRSEEELSTMPVVKTGFNFTANKVKEELNTMESDLSRAARGLSSALKKIDANTDASSSISYAKDKLDDIAHNLHVVIDTILNSSAQLDLSDVYHQLGDYTREIRSAANQVINNAKKGNDPLPFSEYRCNLWANYFKETVKRIQLAEIEGIGTVPYIKIKFNRIADDLEKAAKTISNQVSKKPSDQDAHKLLKEATNLDKTVGIVSNLLVYKPGKAFWSVLVKKELVEGKKITENAVMGYIKDQHWYQEKSDDVKLEISTNTEKFFDSSSINKSGILGPKVFNTLCSEDRD